MMHLGKQSCEYSSHYHEHCVCSYVLNLNFDGAVKTPEMKTIYIQTLVSLIQNVK